MNRLCTICARGGSKGVPGKNIKILQGKPLLAHSLEQARESGLFSALAVSSDQEEILQVARDFGADFLVHRPAALASDTAGKLPAIQHAVQTVERESGKIFPTLVDLDVTSPLRWPKDIIGAVQLLESSKVSNVITGSPARRSPYFNLVEETAEGFVQLAKRIPGKSILRRQDAPVCYDMNASIYVWRRDIFLPNPRVFYPDTKLYEMPEERSFDIDRELDFRIVSLLMQEAHENKS